MNMQMNLVGECIGSHAVGASVVGWCKDGMVSSEWLSACTMQAKDRYSKMAKKIGRRGNIKLANGTKRQRMVATKQQPCTKYWYEQDVVYTGRLL